LNGVLLIERGDIRSGFVMLRAALDELPETAFIPSYTGMLGTLAQALAGVGQVA
jgi:hypothetical protein